MSMISFDGLIDPYLNQSQRNIMLGGMYIGHYQGPRSSYHSLLNPEFPNSINSKKFISKLWKNINEEIRRQSQRTYGVYRYSISRIYTQVFLDRITRSVTQCLKKDISIESDPFLIAIIQIAREDDRLKEVVNIINDFASQPNDTSKASIEFEIEEAIKKFLFNGRY